MFELKIEFESTRLKALQSENGVLSRTMEILNHKLVKEKEKLARLEKV